MAVIASQVVSEEHVRIMAASCVHYIVIKKETDMPRLFRYRRPSVKTILGVTRAKKRLNKQLGITAVKRPFRAPGNAKRRLLRRAGYYSEPMKFLRFLGRLKKKR